MGKANDNDIKILIEYIMDLKNTQLNKMNASSIKIGSLIAFVFTSVLVFINNTPSKSVSNQKVGLLILFTAFLLNLSIILFNIFNNIFRRNSIEANQCKKYSNLEKQIMLPNLLVALILTVISTILNKFSINFIYETRSSLSYTINIIPYKAYIIIDVILLFPIIIQLLRNYIAKGLFENIEKKVEFMKDEINKKKKKCMYIFISILYLLQLTIIIHIVQFSSNNFIFVLENKKVVIFSLYILAIMFSFIMGVKQYSNKIILSWLEKFIVDILKNDLNYEQIKNRFFKEFAFNDNIDLLYFQKNE